MLEFSGSIVFLTLNIDVDRSELADPVVSKQHFVELYEKQHGDGRSTTDKTWMTLLEHVSTILHIQY
ncbi:hypothetical protein EV182_006976 [Spiromyces aspiralis]|uniref:Uncharacterized protein n=1 Tax=Spiromyces aspiralis TaxID=68401 RepID=A0ACC1HAB1_9FUNG|nr:hypothetical protein EV182_006976 [Spiromyces aspiralis]